MKSDRESLLCCTSALFAVTSSVSQPILLASASKLAATPWNWTNWAVFSAVDCLKF